MNRKITIYTLEGCSFCEKLQKELEGLRISFTNINCTKDTNICDKLESTTNCNLYPACIIQSFPSKKIIVSLAKESNQLNQIKTINSETIITYVHSIDNMLTIIKNS